MIFNSKKILRKTTSGLVLASIFIGGTGVSSINLEAEEMNTYNGQNYNVVLTGDHTAEQADIEGSMAVRGDINAPTKDLHSFSIAAASETGDKQHIGSTFNSDTDSALLAGGEVNSNGMVLSVLGDFTTTEDFDVDEVDSSFNHDTITDEEINIIFESFEDSVQESIDFAQGLTQTGDSLGGGFGIDFQTTDNEGTALAILEGDDVKIGEYEASEVLGMEEVIIYSDATTVEFGGGAITTDGTVVDVNRPETEGDTVDTLARNTVFVFPNAETVTINQYGVLGSIIAPNADIVGNGGSVNGQIYADNMAQNAGFEAHNFEFEGMMRANISIQRDGTITVNKYEEETMIPLSGVKYEIFDVNGKSVGIYTTDENGSFTTDPLPVGDYSIVEVDALSGYLLDDNTYEVSIETGILHPSIDLTNTVLTTPDNGVDVNRPDIEGMTPGVDVDRPDIEGIMPEIDMDRPGFVGITPEIDNEVLGLTPGVDLDRPDFIGLTPEIDINRPDFIGVTPEVDVNRPDIEGITPEIDVDRPSIEGITPEVDIDRPDFVGTTPEVDVDRPDIEGVTPEVEVDRPSVEGTTPEVEVNRPSIEGITPEIDSEVSGLTPEVDPNPETETEVEGGHDLTNVTPITPEVDSETTVEDTDADTDTDVEDTKVETKDVESEGELDESSLVETGAETISLGVIAGLTTGIVLLGVMKKYKKTH